MFDISWSEILVIAVVAIVVVGPKDLPRALRVIGQWSSRIKRMAREFQNQFNEAVREAELDSVQRDIEAIGQIDPVADVRAAAAKAGDDIRRDLEKVGEPPKTERESYPWETVAKTEPPSPVVPAATPGSEVAPLEQKP
jgi:sec-independent protein translocase protein TatB